MLSSDDLLATKPRRILVAGVSGVGKTTLAERIAHITGSPHTEIDALFHGAAWVPRLEFLDDVHSLVEQEGWVTEWQYSAARPLLARHADLMVWLDLPFWRVTLPRLVRRTLSRRCRRTTLWNGNIEPAMWTAITDPEHVIRWAVRSRNRYQVRIEELRVTRPALTIVRLCSQADIEEWLAVSLAPQFPGRQR